jgi:hypothetical protein
MIKKSVFEDEIIAGMHKELVKNATAQDRDNLEKAVDYLNSAIDIFEDAGMKTRADKVLNILRKIAAKNVMQMPSIQALIEKGMRPEDVKDIAENPIAKARINKAFRALGYDDKQIANLIGKHNVMSQEEAEELTDESRAFSKMWDWMKDPTKVESGGELKPGDEFSIKSVAQDMNDAKKPKDPRKVSDRHTKGLTSEKMVNNLKNHGTVFNLADDGQNTSDSLDADFEKLMKEVTDKGGAVNVAFNVPDQDESDDLLNADVEGGDLEVSEGDLEDFEDERE